MSAREVQWEEGMFLRPQHFQAGQKSIVEKLCHDEKLDHEHNWGLREIDIDPNMLTNFRLKIHRLRARMVDGSQIAIPEDGSLSDVNFRDMLTGPNALTVYLAVPNFDEAKKNSSDTTGEGTRYVVADAKCVDENNPANEQTLRLRGLNLRLLASTQDTNGYQTLAIARITKNSQGDPQLDPTYIPPLLASDAWHHLHVELLQGRLHQRIEKLLEEKAKTVTGRRLTYEQQGASDRRLFEQLRALNEESALLQALVYTRGVHPFVIYVNLCQMIGRLVIFSKDTYNQRLPPLPRYDHDKLGDCFVLLMEILDAILKEFEDIRYFERPFIGKELRMEVTMDREWLKPNWQFFIGVTSSLTSEQCVQKLKPGGLNMKVGSSGNVDRIYTLGLAGLEFRHVPRPPTILPQPSDVTYFQIDRQTAPGEWKLVDDSLTLAIRLNENLIASTIQGQQTLNGLQTLTLKSGTLAGASKLPQTTMCFTLYGLPIGK